jgi:hypothetical protein
LVHNQREDWNLPSLVVNSQPEAISEQGLHHQAHLVFGRISLCAPLNVKTIGGRPFRQLREQELVLILGKFVCELYVRNQWQVRRSEQPSIGDVDIAGPEREVGTHGVGRGGRFSSDRANIERHLAACRLLPSRHWRLGERLRRT